MPLIMRDEGHPVPAVRGRDRSAEILAPTVFVVDDDPSIRTAVQRLLASVGLRCETFPNAQDFMIRARGGVSGCLVLDVRMPGASGLDLQRMLNEAGLDRPIVFVTAHADVPLTVRAMKAGALEVLTKPFDDQVLLDAVNNALEQERVRSHDREELHRLRARFDTLTPREREVMQLVVTGLLNKQVAATLGTTEKTIKVHRAAVMDKMQADSFADLVRMADRLGLSPQAGTSLL
jgi:FixJ family two-component response regulator